MDNTKGIQLHQMPQDLQSMVNDDHKLLAIWDSLTPLARNEWICWVTIVKKEETRISHIVRMKEDLLTGNRRPCCWPGCPHRRPNALKYFSKK